MHGSYHFDESLLYTDQLDDCQALFNSHWRFGVRPQRSHQIVWIHADMHKGIDDAQQNKMAIWKLKCKKLFEVSKIKLK